MSKAVELDLPCHIPGFEGYRDDYFPDHFGVGVIRNKFGKAFSPSLGPMSTDIATFLKDKWACTSGSQKLYLRDSMLRLITQLTAKLRTGELASNSEWMRICTEFQMQIYIAAGDLARYPKLLQHAIHWSLPSCQKLRADIKQARAIFEPFLEERRRAKRKAVEAGEKPPVYDDLAGWLEEGSRNRKYDETLGQLLNAQASCLGASDLLPTILINIAQDRSLAQQLREEILDVVGTEGLTPESLSRLDLMDSVAKESSRMRLIHSGKIQEIDSTGARFLRCPKDYLSLTCRSLVGLKRYAEKNITLSDGFTIPKGSVTAIAMENMWDEAIYSDALVFHGDRFLRQRLLPGQERDARSTTVGSDYLGFGLGRHACPGRFYAASMMKLVLCHILLKYDIASVNDALFMEELEIRPREEELVL